LRQQKQAKRDTLNGNDREDREDREDKEEENMEEREEDNMEEEEQEQEEQEKDLLNKAEEQERERERAFALLEREKSFTEITNYRNSRLQQEADSIIPELVDMITGDSPEEIEASIQGLKDRSSRILESVQQATQAARRDMTGTRVTTPPNAGPLDIETGTRQFTAEDISAMSLNDYAKFRSALLSPQAQGQSKGMLG
jgi:hypothetical protein